MPGHFLACTVFKTQCTVASFFINLSLLLFSIHCKLIKSINYLTGHEPYFTLYRIRCCIAFMLEK